MLSVLNLEVVRHSAGKRRVVLKSGSFELASGELLDIEGNSGEGKTSILWALARLIPTCKGDVNLDGESFRDVPPALWRTRMSLVEQKPLMIQGSIKENLLLPWSLDIRKKKQKSQPNDSKLNKELASLGLSEVSLDRNAALLSVGQAARVALLRVTLCKPRVLLLDEVTANLDSVSCGLVDKKISAFLEEGGSVVRVSHNMKNTFKSIRLTLLGGDLL